MCKMKILSISHNRRKENWFEYRLSLKIVPPTGLLFFALGRDLRQCASLDRSLFFTFFLDLKAWNACDYSKFIAHKHTQLVGNLRMFVVAAFKNHFSALITYWRSVFFFKAEKIAFGRHSNDNTKVNWFVPMTHFVWCRLLSSPTKLFFHSVSRLWTDGNVRRRIFRRWY